MKQFKLLFLFLVIGFIAEAQVNYLPNRSRNIWIAGKFDSTLHIPSGATPSLRTGGHSGSGALFYKTSDSSVYVYTGTQWIKMQGTNIDTTAAFVTSLIRRSDSVFYKKGATYTFAFKDSTGGSSSGITQLGNSGNLWLVRLNDSTYAVDTSTANSFYRSLFVQTAGAYADPAWITSLSWSKITGVPQYLLDSLPSYLDIDSTYEPLAGQLTDSTWRLKSVRLQVGGSTITPTVDGNKISWNITGVSGGSTGIRFDSSYTPMGGSRGADSFVVKSVRIRRNNVTVTPTQIGDSAMYWNIDVPIPDSLKQEGDSLKLYFTGANDLAVYNPAGAGNDSSYVNAYLTADSTALIMVRDNNGQDTFHFRVDTTGWATTNIYNSDGYVNGDRNIDGGGYDINFHTFNKYSIVADSVDIELNGVSGDLEINNLPTGTGDEDLLVIDENDKVKKISVTALEQDLQSVLNVSGTVSGSNYIASTDPDSDLFSIGGSSPFDILATLAKRNNQMGVYNMDSSRTSYVRVLLDSIILEPGFGNLRIDSLNSGSSTDSVLVWDQSTGIVKKRNVSAFGGGTTYKIGTFDSQTRDSNGGTIVGDSIYFQNFDSENPGLVPPGGSSTTVLHGDGTWQTISSGSPAGNFDNIQVNRNGALATPGSDSLTFASGQLTTKGEITLTGGTRKINFGTAGTDPEIFANATNLIFRNNAVSLYTDVTMGAIALNGSLSTTTKINVTTGTNKSAGTGTLASGTATISTTQVTANSLIFIQYTSCSSCASTYISAKTAGTSFVVTSTNGSDASTFNWWIIN